jgi:hypothetical protein
MENGSSFFRRTKPFPLYLATVSQVYHKDSLPEIPALISHKGNTGRIMIALLQYFVAGSLGKGEESSSVCNNCTFSIMAVYLGFIFYKCFENGNVWQINVSDIMLS